MKAGWILYGILGIAILALLLRSKRQSSSQSSPAGVIGRFMIPATTPVGSLQNIAHYKNKEVWDIEWNSDGLPVRVTITRDAIQRQAS